MYITYDMEANGLWYVNAIFSDGEGDAVSAHMFLDGGGGYELRIDISDLNYILVNDRVLKELNTFVSKAKKQLEILEQDEEE